jgi:AcrR family transcriptional regulator
MDVAARRGQILDATTQLIAERGFWGLSMQDVADRCGLTVPGVLHHVGSKDGLLVAVLEHRDDQDARALAAELDRPAGDLSDHSGLDEVELAEICAALVRRNARQPEIVRLYAVLESEALAPDHPANAYFVERQRRVLDAFERMARGRTPHPRRLARHVLALMDGLQIQWLRTPDEVDFAREWEALARPLFADLEPATPSRGPDVTT